MVRSGAAVALLLVGTSCAGDVKSLDDAMGELVEDIPQTLLVSAQDTQICPGPLACTANVHEHRLDLRLRSLPPARRQVFGDSIDVAGSFRLIRIAADHEEVLSEGALTEGRLTRHNSPAGSISVSLAFDLGSVLVQAPDGEHWDAAHLIVTR